MVPSLVHTIFSGKIFPIFKGISYRELAQTGVNFIIRGEFIKVYLLVVVRSKSFFLLFLHLFVIRNLPTMCQILYKNHPQIISSLIFLLNF